MGKAAEFQPPELTETGILDRAQEEWGWDQAKRNSAVKWYGAFLHLVYNKPGGRNFIITKEADQLWHTHISFTIRYRQYCEAILGFYLDHTPIPSQIEGKVKATAADVRYAKQVYKELVDDWNDIRAEIIPPCW